MSAVEDYQGWTNRETWCVALWLNNEQELQEGASAAANQPGEMIQEAAKSLEDFVENLIGDGWTETDQHGFERDLINCALVRVNWVEIAETFREERH